MSNTDIPCLKSIVINKDKKLQRADWSQRPLKNDLLNYAADDVRYLHSLKNILYEKLNSLGRITWVLEECERLTNVKYELPNPEYKFLSVKGSGILKGQQLSVLKSVYEFRENEAILNDRPPFKIFTDSVIVALSSSKLSEIPKLKGLGKYSYGSSLTRLKKAIHTGLGTTPIKRPTKTHSQKQNLNQKLTIDFKRITFANNDLTERLTVDLNLSVKNEKIKNHPCEKTACGNCF